METACCITCHLRLDVCICRCAPRLTLPLHFTVLMHPQEWQKSSNTARLLQHCGIADIVFWHRPNADTLANMLPALSSGTAPVLLFPVEAAQLELQTTIEVSAGLSLYPVATDADTANASSGTGVAQPKVLSSVIILDGTWQQCRKMYRQSAALQSLPLLTFRAQLLSEYSLRKHQQPGGVSTVEAAINVLTDSHRLTAGLLQRYFQCFLKHYEAHRSGHPQTG